MDNINFTDMTDEHIEEFRIDMLKDIIESAEEDSTDELEEEDDEDEELSEEDKKEIAEFEKRQEEERAKPVDPEGLTKLVEVTGADSVYCHEVLHMTQFLHKSLMTEVLQHPTIVGNKEWFKLAFESARNLLKLHNEMGKAHYCEGDDTSLHNKSNILQ